MEETIEGGQRFCRAKHFLCKLQKFHSFLNLARGGVFYTIAKVLRSREELCKNDIDRGVFFNTNFFSSILEEVKKQDLLCRKCKTVHTKKRNDYMICVFIYPKQLSKGSKIVPKSPKFIIQGNVAM